MRFEDNMMPVLTGLVFAIVLGTTAQNSDDILSMFSTKAEVQADDDVFFVRAGTNPTLDVLANDYSNTQLNGSDIQIVTGPLCGDVVPNADGISYVNSDGCEGPVAFTYCLGEGEACDEAEVTMNVRPAPVAVADASLPEKGYLVPLHASKGATPSPVQTKTPHAGQIEPLNAFVVSIAPRVSSTRTAATQISRFMSNVGVADLNKEPSSETAQLVELQPNAVPLSAIRSARYLTSYPSDSPVAAVTTTGEMIELEGATPRTNGIEIDDETVTIEIRDVITAPIASQG